MKLSELVYEVVKNVKYIDDPSFDYESFVLDEFNADQDYANSINNAFTPINEAIHRLSDRNKIAFATLCLGKCGGVVNYLIQDHPVKKVKGVFFIENNNYKTVGYREMGKGKILITDPIQREYWLQYVEDIKNFKRSDYKYNQNDFGVIEKDHDEDLSEYGINETMCSYIIEYAQGKLQEPIAPELANMHLTRAEQYFEDLDEQQTAFTHQAVRNKYHIWNQVSLGTIH